MFSSRILLNISLAIVIAALSVAVYLSSENKETTPKISQLTPASIHSIRIEYNQQITELTRQDGQWEIIKPVAVDADEFRTKAIINIASAGSQTAYQIEKTDLKKYSLDPPKATLSLNQQTFLFGTVSPVNNKRYVYSNEKLFLIDDTFYPLITSGFKNLMRRQLFPADEKISEIRFDKSRIYKNKNGSWISDQYPISADDLKRYVDNWTHIQAYAVQNATPPYSGKKFEIKSDKRTMVLYLQDTGTNTVVINPELNLAYQFDIRASKSLANPEVFSEPVVNADHGE